MSRLSHIRFCSGILLMMLLPILVIGCQQERRYVGKMHSVVVFHSWADRGEEGELFTKTLDEALDFYGVHAQVHHIYLDMISHTPEDIDKNYWPAYRDSLLQWKPELILVNDDPAFAWMIKGTHDDVFRKLPVVFAGINNLSAEVLQDYMNITGFVDQIDIVKACEMITKLTGEKTIIVELDNYPHDRLIRETVGRELAENDKFIDNSDFRLEIGSPAYLDSIRHKTCVMMVSCQNPLQFVDPSRKSRSIATMKEMMKNASNYTFLQVKYDVYSNTLQNRSGKPMFTCIREQFNNPEDIRVIGGYFTTLRTQIFEQAQYVASILVDGQQPYKMPVSVHDKEYLIDHNAISKLNPEKRHLTFFSGLHEVLVEGWGEEYNIINTPFYLKNRRYWIIGVVLFIVIVSVVGSWLFKFINKRVKNYREKLNEEMNTALEMRRNILSDADSTVWKFTHSHVEFPKEFAKQHGIRRKMKYSEFEKHVHPDSLADWNKLKNFRTDLGRRRIRLQLEFQPGTGWHWYDIIYNVTTEASFRWELSGLIISADETMMQQQQLLDAVKEAKEVELKEKFLANFRHVLKGPMDVVLTNSMKIIDTSATATQEEQEAYNNELHRGANELIANIDALVSDIQPVVEGMITDESLTR